MSRLVIVLQKEERFTPLAQMGERLKNWHRCPLCEQISQVHAINEELRGRVIFREQILGCNHHLPAFLPLEPLKNILHKCNMELFLTFEIKDANGKLVQRLHQRSHSYLAQFIQTLYGLWGWNFDANAGPAAVTIKDTGGTSRSYPPAVNTVPTTYSHVWAALRNNTFVGGLDVGTGTAANTTSTNALQTSIANGSGAGQLNYGTMGVTSPAISGSTTSFTITRTFSNASGASITITEAILSAVAFISTGPEVDVVFGNVRDVLASSVTVLNGGSTTGTYTISVTTS